MVLAEDITHQNFNKHDQIKTQNSINNKIDVDKLFENKDHQENNKFHTSNKSKLLEIIRFWPGMPTLK